VELIGSLPDLPVGRAFQPGEVALATSRPIPAQGLDDDALVSLLREIMFEHSTYPGHPMFMGYISGAGTIPGIASELFAACLNQNGGGFRLAPAATEIERHVARFFVTRFGLPLDTAGGTVVSGGAMATLSALKVARDRQACADVVTYGVQEAPPLTVYASSESHAVVLRAVDVLGLGRQALRLVPVDDRGRMRTDALQRALDEDIASGRRPVAVVATAGTTATGAIDPLPAIAELCQQYSIWMHVDAAYGGAVVLSPALSPLLRGIEHADSIAFDPHKWMNVPLGAGLVLYRRISEAFDSFHVDATYTVEDVDRSGSTFDYGSHGIEWSRAFASLKIWLSLMAHGHEKWGRRIEHDVALNDYLAARVVEHADFELVAPPSLSICCFRFCPPGADQDATDALNFRLMTAAQLDGEAYCSNALVAGRFALRTCIVNFRTEAEHVDRMLDRLVQLAHTPAVAGA
jgi:glutamate/tyrosine decarboxylase-like PLP-dependent enzyme